MSIPFSMHRLLTVIDMRAVTHIISLTIYSNEDHQHDDTNSLVSMTGGLKF
jgi:hypothetical protein